MRRVGPPTKSVLLRPARFSGMKAEVGAREDSGTGRGSGTWKIPSLARNLHPRL